MSHTPRNPSIRSGRTRMPSTLRIPSSTPRSTSNISRVFAAGDSSATSDKHTTSEEKLQKQLDSDAGGRTMGLRSRRGSGATVRTVRTVSGVNSGSPPVKEEPVVEESRPIAGPSTSINPVDTPKLPITDDDDHPTRKVNPKTSSSWQRWNNPASSFPRAASESRAKGKGKEKEAFPSAASTNELLEPPSVEPAITPTPADDDMVAPAMMPAKSAEPVPPKGRWWSRTMPSIPVGATIDAPSAIPSNGPSSKLKGEEKPIQCNNQHTLTNASLVPSVEPTVVREEDDITPPHTHAVKGAVIDPFQEDSDAKITQSEPLQAPTGWRGYLWASKPLLVEAGSVAGQPPIKGAGATLSPSQQDTQDDSGSKAEVSLPSAAEPPTEPLPPPPAPSGWSSYLYSFVAKSKAPEIGNSPTSHLVEPTDPIEYQRPAPSPAIPASETLAVPSAELPTSQGPQSVANGLPADLPSSLRKASVSSHSGWLNYLASRASQKKLTNASTASIKSGKERRSMETTEEVMDFSSDPDFPSSQSEATLRSAAEAAKVSSDPKDAKSRGLKDVKEPAKDKVVTRKVSQSLGVPQRAPSIASIKSASASTAPLPPKSRSQKSSGPGLPPPLTPAPPSFVIPTLADTFDRPPRSLPPARLRQQGTGLAWRALGVVGNYVYGGDEKLAGETRGLKEGRRVGVGLPRKLGLHGGSADEGWKHVRRVAVVGVHGWFPAKMLNSVIGEPTGTSGKFANMMGVAVRKFFKERGVEDIRITLMPLEGEGTIESRVDKLYKAYLSNPAWINDLRRADAVFFAAHSQGCIVTTHLISRMIAQGHIRTSLNKEAVSRCEWAFGPIGVVPDSPRRRGYTPSGAEGGYQKVAMLAMCGVHLGPLYSISTSTVIQPYLQWFENAAARELFEFQESDSAVSVAYQKALSMVLENEVRVVLLASYNDQVVPIYGASFCTANHPLLLRALFVDGASYASSDFMTNLLCFAFMLRNAGIDDQRLVEHLSEATAGSLTGVGHSSPYEDSGCYDLAVKYLFLAGPAQQPIPPLSIEPFSARESRSDFELPWIMRALVDSLEVRDLFPGELKDLREGIVAWRPTTKALKEIKRRLEPMAGRQSRLRISNSASSTSLSDMSATPASGKVRSRL